MRTRTARSAVGLCVYAPEKTVFTECNPSLVLDFEVAGAAVPIEVNVFISQRERDKEQKEFV